MAHTHASIKHVRQTKKRTLVNTRTKREIEHLKKIILKKIAAKDATGAKELLRAFSAKIDKATKRDVIKRNTASRRKSRLAKRIQAL
ncbi:30S ribosomal protein S20 [Candidatus Uhrbacteria bacterium]|nr:30S ribosomal protein S20 [Candidatus Uhrbacteria bacterium]